MFPPQIRFNRARNTEETMEQIHGIGVIEDEMITLFQTMTFLKNNKMKIEKDGIGYF